jgi:hypothetical protein
MRVQVGSSTTAPAAWVQPVLQILTCTGIPFFAGRGVARRSAGRELAAACAMVALLVALYVAALCLSAMQIRRIGVPWPGMQHPLTVFAMTCSEGLFAMAGAVLFRRRARL